MQRVRSGREYKSRTDACLCEMSLMSVRAELGVIAGRRSIVDRNVEVSRVASRVDDSPRATFPTSRWARRSSFSICDFGCNQGLSVGISAGIEWFILATSRPDRITTTKAYGHLDTSMCLTKITVTCERISAIGSRATALTPAGSHTIIPSPRRVSPMRARWP